jgi:predicted O-methyltransferase YrrM
MSNELPSAAVPELILDASGPWPALVATTSARRMALSSRRDPVSAAAGLLARTLRGSEPPVIIVIGLGLGWILDALELRRASTRVLAFEPLPDALRYFHGRRDWSSWIESGRLQLVVGPEYQNAQQAWTAVAPSVVPPVIVDPVFAAAYPALIAPARGAAARARRGSVLDPDTCTVRQSMLHHEVLTMLEHAAATVKGAVVEIGAYVGGGTIAMTTGIRDSGRDVPMFTIEPGGSYPDHPHLPSVDIVADWLQNLRRRGLERFVTLLRGLSSDPIIQQTVREALVTGGVSIGLLSIDADGDVQRDFNAYLPLCGKGCLLVVDDYSGPLENTKTSSTQCAVDALVAAGQARSLGVFGWGTWFGVYTPA